MTDARRTENIVNITDTLWKLNRYRLIDEIEKASGQEVPQDCYPFMEWCFRYGAMFMEKAIGGERR